MCFINPGRYTGCCGRDLCILPPFPVQKMFRLMCKRCRRMHAAPVGRGSRIRDRHWENRAAGSSSFGSSPTICSLGMPASAAGRVAGFCVLWKCLRQASTKTWTQNTLPVSST